MKKIGLIIFLIVLISCRKDKDYVPVVYLSPTSVITNLNINIYHNKNNDFNVKIFNTIGSEVLTKNIVNSNQTTISINEFETGFYFVNIEGTNVSFVQKIIKE